MMTEEMVWINVETLETVCALPQADGHWVMQHAESRLPFGSQQYHQAMDCQDLESEQFKHRNDMCDCRRLSEIND